ELAEQLAPRRDERPLAVMIFVATDDGAEPATDALTLASTLEEQDAALAEYQSAWQAAYAEKAGPILDFLNELGFAAKLDALLPVIYAELDPKLIEAIAALPEVRLIQGSQTVEPELDVARREINVHLLPAAYTGVNVVVGQVEVGGRVAVANPSLTHVVQDNAFVCGAADNHSTTVAGVIGSRHAVHRGIAPGARLWAGGSCLGVDAQLQDRSSFGVSSAGVNVLNLSWGADIGGVMSARERFYDALSLNGRVLIVKSAGSTGPLCGGTGRVSSPGNAYNLLAVGAFDDRANPIWSGETMQPCSAGIDPASLHGDREKPEVAAPGVNIMTTSIAAPWLTQLSGTSVAAGFASGTAALAMQRNLNLRTRPEALKSILMATAVHNVEGATRLSEFDGAGGIDAYRAFQIAGGTQGSWKHAVYTCASPAVLDFAVMPLVAGKRTRVVISWGVDPAYAQYAQQPNADLDLQILSPTGASVAISASWDNGYEICEFTPTVTGNFRLRVHKFRCDLSPRFLGAAWYRMP
ncbi:MAG: S8 family serine peptidase, partial [Phycisphaerae bacterium]